MGSLFSYLKILSILLIISGQNPFILLGLVTPRAWTWSQENKVGVSQTALLSLPVWQESCLCKDVILLNVMLLILN